MFTDQPIKTEESYEVKDGSWSIPRANVAHFLLDAVETDQYDKKFIAVAM